MGNLSELGQSLQGLLTLGGAEIGVRLQEIQLPASGTGPPQHVPLGWYWWLECGACWACSVNLCDPGLTGAQRYRYARLKEPSK